MVNPIRPANTVAGTGNNPLGHRVNEKRVSGGEGLWFYALGVHVSPLACNRA